MPNAEPPVICPLRICTTTTGADRGELKPHHWLVGYFQCTVCKAVVATMEESTSREAYRVQLSSVDYVRFQNLGRFRVPRTIMVTEDRRVLARIFENMVVLETNYLYERDSAEYLADHPDFMPLDEGAVAPMYELIIKPNGHIHFKLEGSMECSQKP